MPKKEDEMLKENRITENKKQAKESPQRNKLIYRYTYTYIYIKCSDTNVFVISEHLNYSITCDPRIRGSTIILKLPTVARSHTTENMKLYAYNRIL